VDRLLLATSNRGKIEEYRLLLKGIPCRPVTLYEVGIAARPAEEGHSLEENAREKALFYSRESGLLTLAEDSGLEVEALNGEPGARSARFGGEGLSDAERIMHLLKKLEGIPWTQRQARFRCVIALSRPGGEVRLFHGECRGFIAFEPRGSGGFGYDPVFYVPELGRTLGEVSLEEKNRVSHRARAAARAVAYLKEICRDRDM